MIEVNARCCLRGFGYSAINGGSTVILNLLNEVLKCVCGKLVAFLCVKEDVVGPYDWS